MPIFTQLDAFVNLTSAIAKLPYVKDLSPGHLALASDDNRVYGVPYLADLLGPVDQQDAVQKIRT